MLLRKKRGRDPTSQAPSIQEANNNVGNRDEQTAISSTKQRNRRGKARLPKVWEAPSVQILQVECNNLRQPVGTMGQAPSSQEANNDDGNRDGQTKTSCTKQRNKRGKTRLPEVWEAPSGQTLQVESNNPWKPVGTMNQAPNIQEANNDVGNRNEQTTTSITKQRNKRGNMRLRKVWEASSSQTLPVEGDNLGQPVGILSQAPNSQTLQVECDNLGQPVGTMTQAPSILVARGDVGNRDEQTTASSTKQRNKRGKMRLPQVWEAPSGQTLQVECNNLGQPVGTMSQAPCSQTLQVKCYNLEQLIRTIIQAPSITEANSDVGNRDDQTTTSSTKQRDKGGKTRLPQVWEAPSGQALQVECNNLEQPVGTISQAPSIQEANNDAGNIDEQTTTSSTKQRNKRGKTRLSKVLEALCGQKLEVECNNLGQPVGKHSSTFTSFCGVVARNPELTPLNYDRWDLMPQSFKDKQFALLKEYFEFSEMLGPWINASICRKWRDYKGDLKAKYYDETLPVQNNVANLPPDVPEHQWIHLVTYFESAKAKKLSELGRKGRKCQKALHTSGSKSFARKKYDMEQETQRTIGAVEFYLATHQHKNGSFVDDEAEFVAEQAINNLIDMNVSLDSSSNDAIRLQQEALSQIRGKEHCGRVRGLGLGPTPTQVFGSSRFSANMFAQPSQEVNRLKNRISELESEVAIIPELKSQVATIPSLEARVECLTALIQKNFPYIDTSMLQCNRIENANAPSMSSPTSTH